MVTIAQISDLHLPPLPPFGAGEMLIKRSLGYLSWHRKRKAVHRTEVIKVLKSDLKSLNPDHIHISGDLTNLALDAEYKKSRQFLESLGKPAKISAIPGNHDHYRKDMHTAIHDHWGAYATDPQNETFPFTRIIGNNALIGVNSAVKTAPFMANGKVDEAQLHRLATILTAAKQENLTRIIAIHHPPQDNACAWRRGLFARKAFQDIIAQNGAELILHGHLHKILKGDIAGTPVRGAGSCSAFPNAHYHLLHCDKNGITLEHRLYDKDTNTFKPGEKEQIPH